MTCISLVELEPPVPFDTAYSALRLELTIACWMA